MKALVLTAPGSLDNLQVADIPAPAPGPGEIRVRVRAVGLNPVDYQLAATGHPSWTYPFVLGLDVAGEVDAVGEGVDGWKPGDAVFYHGDLSRPGGFAEFAVVKAHVVVALPEGLSFTDAAALPCAGFTAYQALYRKLHIQSGQTLLVQGGAGGVGGYAVQLAAREGLRVIATCSAANFEYVRGLGASEVIDYTRENVTERIRQLTGGRGVEAIVDTVGPESATAGLERLAFGGGVACVAGLLDFARIVPFTQALSVHELALGAAHLSGDAIAQRDLATIGEALGELAVTGAITPMVSDVLELSDIPRGLATLAGRHVRGKLVARL